MKTFKEMIKEGSIIDEDKQITEELQKLNEASSIERKDIGSNNIKTVSQIENLLKVEAYSFYEGIHGIIFSASYEKSSGMGVRISQQNLKKIANLDIRWVQASEHGTLSFGLPYAKK